MKALKYAIIRWAVKKIKQEAEKARNMNYADLERHYGIQDIIRFEVQDGIYVNHYIL